MSKDYFDKTILEIKKNSELLVLYLESSFKPFYSGKTHLDCLGVPVYNLIRGGINFSHLLIGCFDLGASLFDQENQSKLETFLLALAYIFINLINISLNIINYFVSLGSIILRTILTVFNFGYENDQANRDIRNRGYMGFFNLLPNVYSAYQIRTLDEKIYNNSTDFLAPLENQPTF